MLIELARTFYNVMSFYFASLQCLIVVYQQNRIDSSQVFYAYMASIWHAH